MNQENLNLRSSEKVIGIGADLERDLGIGLKPMKFTPTQSKISQQASKVLKPLKQRKFEAVNGRSKDKQVF